MEAFRCKCLREENADLSGRLRHYQDWREKSKLHQRHQQSALKGEKEGAASISDEEYGGDHANADNSDSCSVVVGSSSGSKSRQRKTPLRLSIAELSNRLRKLRRLKEPERIFVNTISTILLIRPTRLGFALYLLMLHCLVFFLINSQRCPTPT